MEYIEANPLPAACVECQEEECYNCDHAGERWKLSERDELLARRKMLAKSAERIQGQIKEIDAKLSGV